jgi:hypothetical protein
MGITFFDLKGRTSFAKWIGDIRFPDISEELNSGYITSYYNITALDMVDPTNKVVAKPLGIKFEIDWDAINTDYPELLEQLSGFQIVRCLRTTNDSTIRAQGLILPTHYPTVVAGSIKDANYSTYNITSAIDYENGGNPIAIPNDPTGGIPKVQDTLNLVPPPNEQGVPYYLQEPNQPTDIMGQINQGTVLDLGAN